MIPFVFRIRRGPSCIEYEYRFTEYEYEGSPDLSVIESVYTADWDLVEKV